MERQAAVPLREQVLSGMRDAIVDGTYAPGVRLKERDLCEAFDVSRTVVREVLRQLETEQLVRIEPQVGPVVVTLSPQDIRDLYEVRAVLEGTAGKLAARHGTDTQLEGLAAIYDEITLADGLPMSELITLKNRFYAELVEVSGNRVIGQMLDNVQARISQLRRLTLGSPDRHGAMVNELGSVITSILARDPDGAYAACVTHVKSAEAIAMGSLWHAPRELP